MKEHSSAVGILPAMSKPLKWGVRIVAALAVLLVALPLVLPALVPAAWLREEVVRQLSAVVKRPIAIGDVRLSAWGGVSVVVRNLSIGNRDGFSGDPFLSVEEFRLKARLLPLLTQRVAVEELFFQGLSASLERDAAGRGNWEELVWNGKGDGTGSRGGEGAHGLGTILAGGPALVLSADVIRCRETTLAYRDLAAGERSVVRDLDLDFQIARFAVPGEEGLLPLLRGIDGKGEARVLSAEHPGIALDNVSLDLAAAAGKFALKGKGASRAGGNLAFDVALDATPAFSQGARVAFDRFVVDQAFSDRYLAAAGLGIAAGASAVIDGTADLAARGLEDPNALWLSAAGKGSFTLSGIGVGQIAAFEKGFRTLKGALPGLEGFLKPAVFQKLRDRVNDLSGQAVFGVTFSVSEPKVENVLSIATTSSPVLTVPGELEKGTLAIRYTVSEESFGDPELRDLWRDYVGSPHEVTGTAAAPDWNEKALLDRIQRRALSQMFENETGKQKEKAEEQVKERLEDQLKDQLEDLNPFKKKKKR